VISGTSKLNLVKVSLVAMVLCTGLLFVAPGESQNTVTRYANAHAVAFKGAAQSSTATQAAIPDNWKLVISEDGLRIQKADGSDWYWLGDTAWGLFQELNQEDADLYLSTRAAQGFSVIQAVVVMGWNRGWNDDNAYGERPFHNGNEDTPNEAFWQHADWLINKAEEHGLYVAILPAWGSFWTGKFSDNSAKRYATWIANRYKDQENVIWVNGGDTRPSKNQTRWNVIGNALNETDPNHLITFHQSPQSTHLHSQAWLDFDMFQSGHGSRDRRTDEMVAKFWALTPKKPVLDGEQCYEDHHIGWKAKNDTFRLYDVRQVAYWSVFAGGTGVTYGHVHVWDFYHGGNKEDGYEDWKVQMLDDGAVYMGILHQLMMSRPHAGREPAQHLFNSNPRGSLKQRATHGDGYVMAYTSKGQKINIQMPFAQNTCWWFNPRDGVATLIGTFAQGSKDFDCPGGTGRDHDWVLVIDDANKGYGEPGKPGLTPTVPTSRATAAKPARWSSDL
jgi:hypothetical protein